MSGERNGVMELTIGVHEEDGVYWAEVSELPGCFASGDTLGELFDALSEGIALYLQSNDAPGAEQRRRPQIPLKR